MGKSLTKVGNSQAIIIPRALVDKYGLDKVKLIEKEEGILIVPDLGILSFKEKVKQLQDQKASIYKKMKAQSTDSETIDYYENQSLEEIDIDIIDP